MSKSQNNFVTDAINLKSYSLSESDKIVVMYSKDKGLIRGVAKGVKKTKSKLGARMDMFVANTLLLRKGKNLNTICQAEILNSFSRSRQDLDKIFYSMYVSEIINNFGIENDPSSNEVYDLLYSALNSISCASTKIDVYLAVIKFQLKIMKEIGFSIELDTCLHCHKKIGNEVLYFVPQMGGVVCESCANVIHYNKKQMPYNLRDFLKAMSINNFETIGIYEQKATEKVCQVIFEVLKNYITQKSIKKFNSTDILAAI